MLRVTTQHTPGRVVLKLEGRISRDVVAEVEESWQAAARHGGADDIWIDLTDVCLVDPAGQALLARMHRAGVRFLTRGCLIPELVREIAESSLCRT